MDGYNLKCNLECVLLHVQLQDYPHTYIHTMFLDLCQDLFFPKTTFSSLSTNLICAFDSTLITSYRSHIQNLKSVELLHWIRLSCVIHHEHRKMLVEQQQTSKKWKRKIMKTRTLLLGKSNRKKNRRNNYFHGSTLSCTDLDL